MATDWTLCKSCGKALEDDANFCPRCGLPVDPLQPSGQAMVQASAPVSPTAREAGPASVDSSIAVAKNELIQSQRTCERCGKILAANAKFCNACGTPFQASEKRCERCGKILAANAKFCNACGTAFIAGSTPAPSATKTRLSTPAPSATKTRLSTPAPSATKTRLSTPAPSATKTSLPGSTSKLFPYTQAINGGGELPIVRLRVEGASPPILKKGEAVHFADEATVKEVKTVSLGYRGGSHGVSVPIPGLKGVRYRVGRQAGHVQKEQRVVETSRGVLIVTNKRLFLHPAPGHKPINIPLTKILSYQVFPDGLQVYPEGRQNAHMFEIKNSESVAIFEACLGYLTSG
jgi:RNA polymerase subunit RPABC4/transcription elongation factor Spt4